MESGETEFEGSAGPSPTPTHRAAVCISTARLSTQCLDRRRPSLSGQTRFRLTARSADQNRRTLCSTRNPGMTTHNREGLIWCDLVDFPPVNPSQCDYFAMGASEAAQAMQLVRALRDQLNELTAQLAQVERQDVTSMKKGRASAVRLHATALRRDIKEAHALIEQLQRRYLASDERGAPAKRART